MTHVASAAAGRDGMSPRRFRAVDGGGNRLRPTAPQSDEIARRETSGLFDSVLEGGYTNTAELLPFPP